MNHQIKIARAIKIAKLARGPVAMGVILGAVPKSLVETLTASQLAETMNALDAHWHAAKAFATDEAACEGLLCSSSGTMYNVIKVEA